MIEILPDGAFLLVKGGHTMELRPEKSGWVMFTANACTRAWNSVGPGRAWPSMKSFPTLAAVESHYKSWRGIAALAEVNP